MAERTLEDLLSYVKERKQFGRAIGTFQNLSHRIADLAIELECSRLITYDVAARVDAGRGSAPELARLTSMAKVKVTEIFSFLDELLMPCTESRNKSISATDTGCSTTTASASICTATTAGR